MGVGRVEIDAPTVGSPMSSTWARDITDAVNKSGAGGEHEQRIARLEQAIEIMLEHMPPAVRMAVEVLVK